jgi:hypothetical protein
MESCGGARKEKAQRQTDTDTSRENNHPVADLSLNVMRTPPSDSPAAHFSHRTQAVKDQSISATRSEFVKISRGVGHFMLNTRQDAQSCGFSHGQHPLKRTGQFDGGSSLAVCCGQGATGSVGSAP